MEKESEGKISFVDVQIVRKEAKLSTVVYRKNTRTDRYINYSPHHHPRIKTGVITCLRNRAEKVCDQQCVKSEISHLKRTFQANSYPPYIPRTTKTTPYPTSMGRHQESQSQKMMYLPCLCATHIRAHVGVQCSNLEELSMKH